MKRNDLAIVADLNIGDRFYIATDTGKTVYEYLEREGICCDTLYSGSQFRKMKTVQMKADLHVIFLRNIKDMN